MAHYTITETGKNIENEYLFMVEVDGLCFGQNLSFSEAKALVLGRMTRNDTYQEISKNVPKGDVLSYVKLQVLEEAGRQWDLGNDSTYEILKSKYLGY